MHAAGVIIQNKLGKVLLLFRNKLSSEGERWGLVAGKVETGETSSDTVLREAKEEIGVSLTAGKLKFFKSYNWTHDATDIIFDVYTYRSEEDLSQLQLDLNENTEYMWVTADEAQKRTDLMRGMYPILVDYLGINKALPKS